MLRGKMARLVAALMSCLLLLTASHAIVGAASSSSAIQVYYNGQPIEFGAAKPVMKEGRTLVPFRKLFETLGFGVEWTESGGKQQATGKKEGLTIALTIDSRTAKVNGSNVQLDVPAQIIQGSTMVPLRFVSENSGYDVSFSSSGSGSVIQIGTSGGVVASGDGGGNTGDVEPYVVKGRVTDNEGKPLKGVEVLADNMLLYNSYSAGITDKDGYYRIELPPVAVTWQMSGSHTVVIDGKSYTSDLIPEVDEPFAGNTGAIRNFTFNPETVSGDLYLYMDLDSFIEGYLEADVKVKLVHAESGKVIEGYGDYFPGGFGLDDVPVGRYTITAVYAPEGEPEKPILVRIRNKGNYEESIEFQFNPLVEGIYEAHIEFQMP